MSTDGGVPRDSYFGIPAIGVPGRAAAELPAGRPPEPGDAADCELSASSFAGIELRAASVRGLLHRYRTEPRQDRYSVVHDAASDCLVISVCDGVGSLALSHEAAGFVSRWMPREYLAHRDWARAIGDVNERLGRYAADIVDGAPQGSAPHTYGMATTFVGIAMTPGVKSWNASIAWTDDSTVWRLDEDGWAKLTVTPTPDGDPMHHTGVRGLPHPEPRFHTVNVPADRGALFVMTDGVGVPLEAAAEVRTELARWWAEPPDPFTFASQVGFARHTHLDDRTVVGLWFGRESGRWRQ